CSLCIRKFLSYKTQCPTCCVAVSESDLKNNRTLDELVKSFNSARQQLLQLVVDAPVISSPLACSRRATGKSHVRSPGAWPAKSARKEELPVIESFLIKENVLTPTAGPAGAHGEVCKAENHHDLPSSSPEACGKDDEVGSGKSPECAKNHEEPSTSVGKSVEKVECPVCGVPVPEPYVNKHLDGCLAREEKKDSLRSWAPEQYLGKRLSRGPVAAAPRSAGAGCGASQPTCSSALSAAVQPAVQPTRSSVLSAAVQPAVQPTCSSALSAAVQPAVQPRAWPRRSRSGERVFASPQDAHSSKLIYNAHRKKKKKKKEYLRFLL
ncbi:PREDICTED: E3 ubiquitin-protein ligase RAD18, partial [Tinamus guttatus]|uniref:E3 ubiquitin-protein ligase RAD18 n=1 Tax=Tinamus guttatus TaxID=94827 RepID=UPI00052EF9BA